MADEIAGKMAPCGRGSFHNSVGLRRIPSARIVTPAKTVAVVIPAHAGIQGFESRGTGGFWTPAFLGVTPKADSSACPGRRSGFRRGDGRGSACRASTTGTASLNQQHWRLFRLIALLRRTPYKSDALNSARVIVFTCTPGLLTPSSRENRARSEKSSGRCIDNRK